MSIHTEYTTYSVENTQLEGYLAWNKNSKEKRPGILVFPEWWGMNEYIQKRTEQIAELGFLAMGVDMYGEGKTTEIPDQAGSLMNDVINDKGTIKDRVQAAYNVLKVHSLSNPERIGAIGYCFGGALVLNMARLGMDLKVVVSFHGSLDSFYKPASGGIKAKILVCHGTADQMISQEAIAQFKSEMDTAGANYEFIYYEGALHRFSNPDADKRGKKFNIPLAYNKNADKKSWEAMKALFEQFL